MNAPSASIDALATALAEIRTRFGESGFSDRRRVISLLADMIPEAKREIRAVGTAIDEGVPVALASCERHLIGMEMDRLADRLESSTGLRRDIARPVVRAFAFAMDLGPLPSIYVTEPPVVTPAPPAPSGWAGLSEPVSPMPAMPVVPGHHSVPTPPAPGDGTIKIGGRAIPRTQAIGWGIGLAVLLVGWQAFEFLDKPRSEIVADSAGFAQEGSDFGVPPQATLQANVGSPTPLQIPVGKRISTVELQSLLAQDASTVLIDTLDGNHPLTIKGAKFIPFGGAPGSFEDSVQPLLARTLKTVTGDKPERPLVFFCAGANCWESYNAVLRANAAQFRNLYWYRGGLASWQAANLPMEQTPAPIAAPDR